MIDAKNPLIFFRLVGHGMRRNRVFDKAASLSYFTLVAFIPLVAVFVSVYTIFFPRYEEQLSLMLSEFLPYENSVIVLHIREFIEQARALGSVALLVFILITIRVFMIIESNINQVCGVDRRRSFPSRISSFTLLLFWGPILMGMAGSLFFLMQRHDALPTVAMVLFPKLITLTTFTMLYLTVPYTKVRYSSALLGGTSTMILLTVGKGGFVAYLRSMKAFSGILGSLGLVLLFFIAVNLLWLFILLGTLITYTHQNFRPLLRELNERDIPPERYRAVRALCVLIHVADRFVKGGPPLTVDRLSQTLSLPLNRLEVVVTDLVSAGLLIDAGQEGQIRLARAPWSISAGPAPRHLVGDSMRVPTGTEAPLPAPLITLIDRFRDQIDKEPWTMTIDEMVRQIHGSESNEHELTHVPA